MGGRGEKTARGEEEDAQEPREEGGGGSGEPKAKKARGGASQQQQQGQEQLSLAIQPPVPRFPFVNHFFDVHVHLFDEAHQVKAGEEFELPLQAQLLLDDKDAEKRVPVPTSKADQVLEVDPKEPRLGRNGKASFRVRVKDVSMNYDNRPMLLKVSAAGPNSKGAAASFSIAPVVSDPMTVIRHRLRIRSETQPPTVWYKDEGGRDKCIEMMVDLVDPEGRRVHGQQEVPLKVSLLYEDLHAVGKQDILKLSSDSRQAIDATGTATLRLRIEDVSKNHQSKGFVVRVAPDVAHAPLNADISPDISTSVSVRSKRNRRSKHPGAGGAGAGGLHHAQGHAAARMDDEPVSLVGHAIGGRSSMELAMPGVPHSILQDAAQLSMQAASASAGGGANGGAGAGANGAAADGVEGAVAGVSGPPVIRALSNVIAWTRAVVNGLYQIQWQLIGYESRPDGSPDISKPLFNIHNPNAVVTNILQSYRAETMDQLRFLVQTLEPSQGGADAGGAGRGAGGQQGPGQKSDQQATGQAYGGEGAQGGGTGGAGPPGGGRGGGGGGQAAFYCGDGSQGHPGQGRPQLAPMPLLPPMSRAASAARADAGGEFGAGVGGMLPLVRESTYDLLAGMDPSWFGDAEGPSAALVAEASVQSVVAKEYTSPTYDTLGFPAFDAKEALVGFFKEGRNEQGQTVAFFVPLPPSFAEEEKRAVGGMLQDENARGGGGGGAVVQMVNNDIVQLKERVLTYHWSKGSEGRDGGGSIHV